MGGRCSVRAAAEAGSPGSSHWRDEKLELSRPTAPSSLVSWQSALRRPPPQPSPTRGEGFLGSLSEDVPENGVPQPSPTRGEGFLGDSTLSKCHRQRTLVSWQSPCARPPPQPSPTKGEGFLGDSTSRISRSH